MSYQPCSNEPDLWFGYSDDDTSDGAAKARVYEQSATRARMICLRRCPLAQQRQCAARAVDAGEEYGVWAGVKLPGGQYRKRHQLAHAHRVLRDIAAGLINPRELPESVELLSRGEAIPALSTTVVHLSGAGRPRNAA
ncbi:MAG: WhiB family transcriptional regulator [Mycobacterium sp.]